MVWAEEMQSKIRLPNLLDEGPMGKPVAHPQWCVAKVNDIIAKATNDPPGVATITQDRKK
jgi:hypothetical protein